MTTTYIRILPASMFFMFILSIIFLADTSDKNFAFELIGHIAYGDKLMHGLLYGLMAWALNFALDFRTFGILKFEIQKGAVWVFVFAFLEELSQIFIASRTFDVGDIWADIVGIVLFSMIKQKDKAKKERR